MAGERFIHELKPQELLQPLSCVVLFLVLHSCLALEATPQNHNLSQHKCSTQRTLPSQLSSAAPAAGKAPSPYFSPEIKTSVITGVAVRNMHLRSSRNTYFLVQVSYAKCTSASSSSTVATFLRKSCTQTASMQLQLKSRTVRSTVLRSACRSPMRHAAAWLFFREGGACFFRFADLVFANLCSHQSVE